MSGPTPRATSISGLSSKTFPETVAGPGGVGAPSGSGRGQHDWTDWTPITDPGVDEDLSERNCRSCGAEQIAATESLISVAALRPWIDGHDPAGGGVMTQHRSTVKAALVRIDQIRFHPANIRRELGDLRDLSNSIRRYGVLQPVVLERFGDTLRLRMGHRRVAAAQLAGLRMVPALIHSEPLDERSFLLQAVQENFTRTPVPASDRIHTVDPAAGARLLVATDLRGVPRVAEDGRGLGHRR